MDGADEATCSRCVYCGSGDLQLIDGILECGFYVCCLSCECQGPPAETAQLAIEKWCQRYGTVEILGYTKPIADDQLI